MGGLEIAEDWKKGEERKHEAELQDLKARVPMIAG
jgi:hypothetical protein